MNIFDYYITKRDTNGNRYTLEVNRTARTYRLGYNPFYVSDWLERGAEITKRERDRLIKRYEADGYTRIF